MSPGRGAAALNRGVFLTPFHNMALLTPNHTERDVDEHAAIFAAAVRELVERNERC